MTNTSKQRTKNFKKMWHLTETDRTCVSKSEEKSKRDKQFSSINPTLGATQKRTILAENSEYINRIEK